MEGDNFGFEIQISKSLLEQIFKENPGLKHKYDEHQQNITNSDQETSLKAAIHLMKDGETVSEENPKLFKQLTFHITENPHEKIGKSLETGNESKGIDETVSRLKQELKKAKELLAVAQQENQEVDLANLYLERQLESLNKKLRLEEERNKSNDLANVECKLLKLKLQSIENEKKFLLDEFEKERKIITKQHKPRVAKLEENLKHLRRWIEKEAKERRPYDTEEVKTLKAKIHILEHDKNDLIEGFELERKVFQKILKSNTTYNLP